MQKKETLLNETQALKTKTRLVKEGDILGGETPQEAQAKTVNRKVRRKLLRKRRL